MADGQISWKSYARDLKLFQLLAVLLYLLFFQHLAHSCSRNPSLLKAA